MSLVTVKVEFPEKYQQQFLAYVYAISQALASIAKSLERVTKVV